MPCYHVGDAVTHTFVAEGDEIGRCECGEVTYDVCERLMAAPDQEVERQDVEAKLERIQATLDDLIRRLDARGSL